MRKRFLSIYESNAEITKFSQRMRSQTENDSEYTKSMREWFLSTLGQLEIIKLSQPDRNFVLYICKCKGRLEVYLYCRLGWCMKLQKYLVVRYLWTIVLMVSSTLCLTCAGILKQSMGARNRVRIELGTKSVEALRSVDPLSNGSPLIFHLKKTWI